MSFFEKFKFEKMEGDTVFEGLQHIADIKPEDGGCAPVRQVRFADDLRPAAQPIQSQIDLPSSDGGTFLQAPLAKGSASITRRDDANSSEGMNPSPSAAFASDDSGQVFSLDAASPLVQPFAEQSLDPPMVEDQADYAMVMSARLTTKADPLTEVTWRHDTVHGTTADDHAEHVEGTHPEEVVSHSLPSNFANDVGDESQPAELDAGEEGVTIAAPGRVHGSLQTDKITHGIGCAHDDSQSKRPGGGSHDNYSPAPTLALAGNIQTDEDQSMPRMEPAGSADIDPSRTSITATIITSTTDAAAATPAVAGIYCSSETRSSTRGSHHQSFTAHGRAKSMHSLPLLDKGAVLIETPGFVPMQMPLTVGATRPGLTAGGTSNTMSSSRRTIEPPIEGPCQQGASSPELGTAHLQPVDSSLQLPHAEIRQRSNERTVEASTSCDLRKVASERSIVLAHGIAQEADTPTGKTVDPGLEHIAQSQTKDRAMDHNNSLAMVVYTGDRTENRTSKFGNATSTPIGTITGESSSSTAGESSSSTTRPLVKIPTANSGRQTREIFRATHGCAVTTLARTNSLTAAAGNTESRHRQETARIVERLPCLLTAEEITADTATHWGSNATGRSEVHGGSRFAGDPMPVESGQYPSGPGTDRKQRSSDWVVISAEQAEQAAKTLRREADKIKALESTVRTHKRERVLIYDAAMKQAAKREADAISEATQSLQREQLTMRTELDAEMRKVRDLYQERCRDYALMVSDECEGEISKRVTGLRKDWARQKKTIEQLVRDGDGEDRQVALVASAIMEHLAEERKQELDDMRAEIYTDVRAEFEAREVAMKDSLQNDHQSELEGQLLLAEIRHQKELDRLRMELSGIAVTVSASDTPSTGSVVTYQPGQKRTTEETREAINSDAHPSTPSPSFTRGVRVAAAGENIQRSRGVGSGEKTALGGGIFGLRGKLPAFKMPAPTAPPNDAGEKGVQQKKTKTSGRSSSTDADASPSRRARVKRTFRTTTTDIGITKRSANVAGPSPIETSPERKEDQADINLTEGITSKLMVSPTKSVAELKTVTPSMDATTEDPPRPKKRCKRLFMSTAQHEKAQLLAS